MALEERPDAWKLSGVAVDDRVRVAELDRGKADTLELLALSDS